LNAVADEMGLVAQKSRKVESSRDNRNSTVFASHRLKVAAWSLDVGTQSLTF